MRKIKRTMQQPNGITVDMPESRPRIEFSGQDLPEMDSWDVGDKYVLTIEVEMTSFRKGSEWNDKDKETRGTFKVNAVGVGKPEKKTGLVDNDEYAEMMDEARR